MTKGSSSSACGQVQGIWLMVKQLSNMSRTACQLGNLMFLQNLPYACGHVERMCQNLAWWSLWKWKNTSFKMTHICPKMLWISIDITHSTHVLYREAIQMGPKLLSLHGIAVIMRHMRPTYDIWKVIRKIPNYFNIYFQS